MVFLTLSCWIRNRGPDRYWKVQELLKSAREEPLLQSGGARRPQGLRLRQQSSESQATQYETAVDPAPRSGQQRAAHEALTALAHTRRTEGFRAALGDGSEPPGVFSRITQPITAQHG
ncbi:hypothetical protein G5714_021187 [Onychostoma macrolepis]|uniref:Uncharacterized protein n=1 Tax=Onychostoma macrolepis TaxID=369639 RepID=A0A7J6BQ84_9TELE|nr:hypothetical protein G5714_021187 [Onychostoma macrolepis]